MSEPLFSLRVDAAGSRYTFVTILNRGIKAGTISIFTSDLDEFRSRLCGVPIVTQDAEANVTDIKIDKGG